MKLNSFNKLIIIFSVTVGAFVSMISAAQGADASARHYTEKPVLFDGERQTFYIDINNPTSSPFRVVRATVSFSILVEVRSLDGRCSETRSSNITQIICILPELESGSFERLSYSIVGDTDIRPGFTASIVVSSVDGDITVQDPVQAQDLEGKVDNSQPIEGSSFSVFIARNILLDSDADGISDISERLIGTDPSNPFSVSNQNAVIDVAVLQSEETDRHYDGRYGGRIEYLIAATNQFYRENKVGITLRLVALGTLDYSSTALTLNTVADEFLERSNVAFNDVDLIIENTGADVVLFAHPVFPVTSGDLEIQSTVVCGVGLSNSEAILGDFYQDFFSTRMLSVLNSSRNCVGRENVATLLALNMGIVKSRILNPEGGTFPFSSGYVEGEYFETIVPGSFASETTEQVRASRVNLFSSPERLCLGRPCGIDRNDLVNGADAVFSSNATAHIIAALSPAVVPITAADIEPKITVAASNKESIEVRQFSTSRSIIRGDWVSIQVEARNTSADVLSNLEFRFSSYSESEVFRTGDNQCSILARSGAEIGQDLFGSREGQGDLVCYVNSLQPGQTAGFSYSVRADNSIFDFGQNGFLSFASVNSQLIRDGQACFIVSENSAERDTAVDVCSSFIADANLFTDPVRDLDRINLALLPEIIESVFTVPFVRIFDGGLVSAQFRVIEGGAPRSYELIDLNYLSSFLSPNTAAQFGEDGQLTINNATIDGLGGYNMTLRLAEGSGAPMFVESEISRP